MSPRPANLGLLLLSRFNYGHTYPSVIHRAISCLQKGLQLTPDVPSTLDCLGVCLNSRFLYSGDLSGSETAIYYKLRAL